MYLLLRLVLGPPLWLLCRPRVRGLEHLPRRGPVIVASNHLAAADSLCLCLVLPRRLSFVAKSEYFTGTTLRARLLAWTLRAAGQIPIDRSDPAAAARSLDAARALLEAGGAWAIYPEGTRSPDGRVHRGRTGVARVALSSGVPVLPVTVDGTDRLDPTHRRGLRPARVRVTVGSPLHLHVGPDGSRPTPREATDRLMRALVRQSGRAYVDTYARR